MDTEELEDFTWVTHEDESPPRLTASEVELLDPQALTLDLDSEVAD